MKIFTRFQHSPARVRRTTLAALAALAIAFTFAACDNGSSDDSTADGGNDTTQTDTTTQTGGTTEADSGTTAGGNEETTQYTVTIAEGITNGSVNASPTTAAAGATITLSATPDSGYKLSAYTVTAGSATVTVENGTFTMPESNVTVSATFEALPPNTYSISVSGAIGGSVTADKTSATANETVTLTATPATGYKFVSYTVKDASGNAVTVTNGTFTMPASNVTIEAAFKSIYIGIKAPTAAKAVGDIVFSDGSATPYTNGLTLTEEQKNAAIAVIFYVGTECSNDSTNRTLGVGLVHNRSELAWCTEDANAYSKNITTIHCTPSGSAGALTFTGVKDGSDNLAQISAFLSASDSGTTDDTATEANYPAFYFAKNYASQTGNHVSGTDYEDGWYLPTIAELFQIWKSRESVDAASDLCGGSKFNSSYYWSSSQCVSYDNAAWRLNFGNGDRANYSKDFIGNSVCAVRAFN